jgi:hypothetical protein
VLRHWDTKKSDIGLSIGRTHDTMCGGAVAQLVRAADS